MTPEPAEVVSRRSRCAGRSKNSCRTGSPSAGTSTCSTRRVAMLTTPGVTTRTIGATVSFAPLGRAPAKAGAPNIKRRIESTRERMTGEPLMVCRKRRRPFHGRRRLRVHADSLFLRLSVIHPAHRHGRRALLLRKLRDHGFRRDQQTRDGGRVLKRSANDLGRVDDPLLIEIAIFAGLRVEAMRVIIGFEQL